MIITAFQWVRMIALAAVVVAAFSMNRAYGEDSDRNDHIPTVGEVQKLGQAIADHNSSIKNVKLDFEMWNSIETAPGQFDKLGPQRKGTAWFDGTPRGKARVHIVQELLRWENGPADFFVKSYEYGFNGRQGQVAQHAEGALGNTTPIRTGRVINGRPPQFDDQWHLIATGAGFTTLLGYSDPRGRSLAERFLSASDDSVGRMRISTQLREGRKLTVLSLNNPPVHQEYAFDPAKGHALVSYERVSQPANGVAVTSRFQVTELTEAMPGVWFPVKGYRDYVPNGRCYRAHFVGTHIQINNPRFDERVFTVQFPVGYLVKDEIQNIEYTISSDGLAARFGKPN